MNKSKTTHLRNKLLEELSPFYERNGFAFIIRLANFKKDDKTVIWGESENHIDSLIFRPRLKIENKKIQNILSSLFPNVIGVGITIIRAQSSALIEEMAIDNFESNFLISHQDGSKSYYYLVETDSNLNLIVQDHIRFMNDVGFPFFNSLSSLHGINEYINCPVLNGDREYFKSKDRQIELKKFLDKREVLSGVVAAHLTDCLEVELLERYRFLFADNSYILNDLDLVMEFFDHNQEA